MENLLIQYNDQRGTAKISYDTKSYITRVTTLEFEQEAFEEWLSEHNIEYSDMMITTQDERLVFYVTTEITQFIMDNGELNYHFIY